MQLFDNSDGAGLRVIAACEDKATPGRYVLSVSDAGPNFLVSSCLLVVLLPLMAASVDLCKSQNSQENDEDRNKPCHGSDTLALCLQRLDSH